jgi:2-dehydropantoate 2-reductase
MRIAIVGAGAVGCLIAARMPPAEHQVTLIARRTAAVIAIRREGIQMISPEGLTTRHPVAITDDALSIGPQDLVILCVKAYSLRGVLTTLAQLIGPRTAIVPIVNGIPWWYPYGQPAPLAGCQLRSLDDDGSLAAIPLDRVVGTLTDVTVETPGVGRIRHVGGQRFTFGDPVTHDRSMTMPTNPEIAALFWTAGFESVAVADIRPRIWTKLAGDLAFNPLSVLTGASPGKICADPGSRAVVRRMMEEAAVVAEHLGAELELSIGDRIAASAATGNVRTSMLLDYLAGKRLELDSILGSVIELAGVVDIDVPTLRTIYALTALRAQGRNDET